jgi:hypothetical protein
MRLDTDSEHFDFPAGARVTVRVREHGTTGTIKAKFEADVKGFQSRAVGTSDQAVLDPPWDSIGGVSLGPHDAEFELLDAAEGDA